MTYEIEQEINEAVVAENLRCLNCGELCESLDELFIDGGVYSCTHCFPF